MNQFTASLWGDEAFSAILSMKSVREIISIIIRDTSPPLYNLTEHFWFGIFGTSEVAIRSLSFLYYLIAIFFVYKIGSYLWSRKTGLLAAVLTFLNPFFFIYAFEGRMYSIMAMGTATSMYFFVRLLFDKKPTNFHTAGYILFTAWSLYCHHFAIFAVFVQGFWFLVTLIKKNRKRSVRIFISFLIVGLLYTPWLMPLYNQTKMVGTGFWLGKPTMLDLVILLGRYLAAGSLHSFTIAALYLALLILILRRWFDEKLKSLFLASWFIVPIAAVWLISQKFTSILYDRYLLYTIPGAILILASNLRTLEIGSHWKLAISNYLALVFIGLLVFIDFSYFTHPTKRPFRELATYVKEIKKGDDYLINWSAASHHLWEMKYYGIPGPLYIPGENNLPYFVGTALMTKDDVINKLPDRLPAPCKPNIKCEAKTVKVERIGVITSGPVEDISLPGYTRLDTKTFGDLKFVWYKPPSR